MRSRTDRSIEGEVWVRLVLWLEEVICLATGLGKHMVLAIVAVSHIAQTNSASHILQFAIAVGSARQAIERMVGDVEFHDAFAEFREAISLRRYFEAGRDWCSARCRRSLAAFNFAQAQAARAECFHVVGGTELGDLDAQRVTIDGVTIELSPTEYRLLLTFLKNQDRVLTRAVILDKVWSNELSIDERTVDVHVRRLRVALRAAAQAGYDEMIETVRGGGYRLAVEDDV